MGEFGASRFLVTGVFVQVLDNHYVITCESSCSISKLDLQLVEIDSMGIQKN